MFVVYKLVQVLLAPELWIVASLIGAWMLARSSKRWRLGRWLCIFPLLVSYGFQIGPANDILLWPLEFYYSPISSTALPGQDAVIVLAGAVTQHWEIDSPTILGTSTLPRLLCGITRWRDGVAPFLVVSGGAGDPFRPQLTAADLMQTLAIQLGVPASAILTEIRSRTTAESAVEVRRMFSELHRIGLVTSASHLPRATALFRKQGFEVTPAPCDYLSGAGAWVPMDFLPNAAGLTNISIAIHEYVGLAVLWALDPL